MITKFTNYRNACLIKIDHFPKDTPGVRQGRLGTLRSLGVGLFGNVSHIRSSLSERPELLRRFISRWLQHRLGKNGSAGPKCTVLRMATRIRRAAARLRDRQPIRQTWLCLRRTLPLSQSPRRSIPSGNSVGPASVSCPKRRPGLRREGRALTIR